LKEDKKNSLTKIGEGTNKN